MEIIMDIPVYLKHSENEPLPRDPVSYSLTGSGLYINRNTVLLNASVPCKRPREWARHSPIVEWKHPIPQRLAELAVGFFTAVDRRQKGAEAVVLLGWHPQDGYLAIVPEQTVVVARCHHGIPHPASVSYQVPPLPPGMLLAGDIHSHSYLNAFDSETDVYDMQHKAGLHIVVGQVDLPQEPPDLHATVYVDGFQFIFAEPLALFEGYQARSLDLPPEWLANVEIREVPVHALGERARTLIFPKKKGGRHES